MAGGEVKRVTEDMEKSSLDDLQGKEVQGSDGNQLGNINDFMVDGSTGEIKHVVISTGGLLGVGDKLRVLPPSSLTRAGDDTFSADMPKSEFEAMPVISETDLDAGRVASKSGTQQSSPSASSSEAATSSQPTGQLVRASELDDKSIRSDNSEVGEIDDVVVDLQAGKAMALVEVNPGFAEQGGEYLVPFSKLQVSTQEADTIGSTLLRSDFESMQSSSTAVASDYSTPASSAGATSAAATASYPSPATSTTESGASDTSQASTSSQSMPSTRSSDVASSSTPSSSRTSDSSTAGTQSSSSSDLASSSSTPSTIGTSGASSSSASERSSSSTDASQVASSTSPSSADASDASVLRDTSRSTASADTANRGGVATPTPLITTDEELTPTGTSSADQSPASSTTAMAIRRALDNDATLAQEDVQVTTKIVLQGSVQDEEAKKRIEDLAKKAAGNAEIDNQIKVQKD